jgi:hypothetical protein
MDQTKEQLLDEWLYSDLKHAKPVDEIYFDYGRVQTVIFRRYGNDIKVSAWDYWLVRDKWNPKEATCLLYEIDPDKLSAPVADLIGQYESLKKLYRMAEERGPMSPYQWMLFAKERKVYIPIPLQDIESRDREINDHSVTTELQTEAALEIDGADLEPTKPQRQELDNYSATIEQKTEAVVVRNDVAFSGLINDLSRKDDWFQLIDDMTRDFYKEHETIPNEVQAWGRLWAKSPAGYEITTGTEKGEDCLKMPGVSPLSRSAFAKRWRKYSANSGQ